MKNLAKSTGLLFVALGALCVTSCSEPNDAMPKKAAVSETTTVSMDLKGESDSNPTGKTVNRGTLHAWISEIDINVKSNDFNYAPFTTPFILTNDAAGTALIGGGTVDGTYNLENVAIGSNDFTVTTKTNTVPSVSYTQILAGVGNPTTAEAQMATAKGLAPYALYGANILNRIIIPGANTLPQTELKTNNGRAIAVFKLSQNLIDLGVTANVKLAQSAIISTPQSDVLVSFKSFAKFYWSNEKSVAGATANFVVELKNANNVVYKTLTVSPLAIAASTSVNNIYVINDSSVTCNTVIETFTAQSWNNNDNTIVIE